MFHYEKINAVESMWLPRVRYSSASLSNNSILTLLTPCLQATAEPYFNLLHSTLSPPIAFKPDITPLAYYSIHLSLSSYPFPTFSKSQLPTLIDSLLIILFFISYRVVDPSSLPPFVPFSAPCQTLFISSVNFCGLHPQLPRLTSFGPF